VSGDIYKGDWKEGQRDGTGTFYGQDGSIYRGEYKDNQV